MFFLLLLGSVFAVLTPKVNVDSCKLVDGTGKDVDSNAISEMTFKVSCSLSYGLSDIPDRNDKSYTPCVIDQVRDRMVDFQVLAKDNTVVTERLMVSVGRSYYATTKEILCGQKCYSVNTATNTTLEASFAAYIALRNVTLLMSTTNCDCEKENEIPIPALEYAVFKRQYPLYTIPKTKKTADGEAPSDYPDSVTVKLENGDVAVCAVDNRLDDIKIVVDITGQKKTVVMPHLSKESMATSVTSTNSFEFAENGYNIVKIVHAEDPDTSYGEFNIQVIPGWLTLLPAIVMFIVAVTTQMILVALPVGVWMGAWLMDVNLYPWDAFLRVWDTYFVNQIADGTHAFIIAFTLVMAGSVAIITKNGGTYGLAKALTPCIRSSYSAKLTAFLEGILIFFDDYADTLISGGTLRHFMDDNRVSREKFSFIVDATAAPIASIAPISSWIGYEVGLIQSEYVALYAPDSDAYIVFLDTLPYRFYPIMMLVFMFLTLGFSRDFGSMVQAERRARKTGKVVRDGADVDEAFLEGDKNLEPNPEVKERGDFFWYLAAIPVLTLILGTFIGIITTGWHSAEAAGEEITAKNIFSNGDSFKALMWASVFASIIGVVLAKIKGTLTFKEGLHAWTYGMKSMIEPLLILIWAWALGQVLKDIYATTWLASSLGGAISPTVLPFLSFIIAGLMSLMIGSSWGTMAVMFPLLMPLAWNVGGGDTDVEAAKALSLHCIGTILAGSVWGDHCSPISDTTVLSSIACGCDHQDHVKTQLWYALTVGFVSSIFGDLITGAGCPPGVSHLLGYLILGFIVFFFGVRIPEYNPTEGKVDDEGLFEEMSLFERYTGCLIYSHPYVEDSDLEAKDFEEEATENSPKIAVSVDAGEDKRDPFNNADTLTDKDL